MANRECVLATDNNDVTHVIEVPNGVDVGDVKDMIDGADMTNRGTVYRMTISELRKRVISASSPGYRAGNI